jgi:butyryl-CoA dehydrogenase
MPVFSVPLRDHAFCLFELFDWTRHMALPGLEDLAPDVVIPVLEQAARFATDIVWPLNRTGDEAGCRLENGGVVTPPGFRQAYRALCEGGWAALTCDPADGGQGLPHMVNALFEEMLCGAAMSFGLFPGLTRGAYVALKAFGAPPQQALYLPRLASGEWAGAMCLTEAEAGTDLGLLRSRAMPRADGSFAITGSKIFISAGDHDLTPNIVYLVLARLPEAPKGTKGISLFLVPKVLPDGDGRLGARNAVSCTALERKMGIHACPTCVMSFDGATGWLVGAPHEGLKAMFAMMNTERIAVGIQGLAVAQAATTNAAAYARQRQQGRSPTGPQHPDKPADPIIVHPDVRRMLMTMRALTEGGRMLALETARHLDIAERDSDAGKRHQAARRLALLTPVAKAFLTDIGSEVANLGMQVLGGHGYMRDNGQEQYVRDVRVTQIYEGTNGVQAMDFLGRKVLPDGGKALGECLAEIDATLESAHRQPELAALAAPLAAALSLLRGAKRHLLQATPAAPEEVGAAAVEFQRLFALTLTGHLWLRAASLCLGRAADEDFYRVKLATARYYLQRILPQTAGLHGAIMAGAAPLMALADEEF